MLVRVIDFIISVKSLYYFWFSNIFFLVLNGLILRPLICTSSVTTSLFLTEVFSNIWGTASVPMSTSPVEILLFKICLSFLAGTSEGMDISLQLGTFNLKKEMRCKKNHGWSILGTVAYPGLSLDIPFFASKIRKEAESLRVWVTGARHPGKSFMFTSETPLNTFECSLGW